MNAIPSLGISFAPETFYMGRVKEFFDGGDQLQVVQTLPTMRSTCERRINGVRIEDQSNDQNTRKECQRCSIQGARIQFPGNKFLSGYY